MNSRCVPTAALRYDPRDDIYFFATCVSGRGEQSLLHCCARPRPRLSQTPLKDRTTGKTSRSRRGPRRCRWSGTTSLGVGIEFSEVRGFVCVCVCDAPACRAWRCLVADSNWLAPCLHHPGPARRRAPALSHGQLWSMRAKCSSISSAWTSLATSGPSTKWSASARGEGSALASASSGASCGDRKPSPPRARSWTMRKPAEQRRRSP